MDSTFIGLLVAIDGRMKSCRAGLLRIVNPSDECEESLRRLGLGKVLSIERTPVRVPAEMRELHQGKPSAEFILKTHEALMEKSEEARKRFSLLKKLLEEKIQDNP